VVCPRQYLLAMEIIRVGLPVTGPWKTSVVALPFNFTKTDGIWPFVAGAGKSVLWCVKCSTFPFGELMTSVSSAIIQDIDDMRKRGLASLAFFYHDFNEDEKRNLRGLLSSVLVQLCYQSDSYQDILSKFYEDHASGSQDPSDDELVGCLKDVLILTGQAPVFLIMDALDECSDTSDKPSPREEVLECLEGLIKLQVPNLRICVTSRPEIDITTVLDRLTSCSVSIHEEKGQIQDIVNYINWAVNEDPKNQKRWKPEDRKLAIEVLTKNARGM
jgi:NACHT domain